MKKYATIIQTITLSILLLGTTSFVFAQTPTDTTNDYAVLAPLPGTTVVANCGNTSGPCTANLSTYLPGIFNIMIGVGALASFVVITIGGLEYLLTDSLPIKAGGKKMIENALWGLGFIIFSYAILYTINPALLKGSLNITPPTVTTPATVTGGALGSIGNPCSDPSSLSCSQEQNTATRLYADSGGNISINKPCQSISCPTQIANLQQTTIQGIEGLQKNCGCSIVITGGDETNGPHSSTGGHPNGTALDVSPNLAINSYLGYTTPKENDTKNLTINGRVVMVKYEVTGTNGTSTGPHWHIQF